MTPSKGSPLGVTACALATVGWGFGAIFVKSATTAPLALTFLRLWLGVGLLFAVAAVTGHRPGWSTIRSAVVPGALLCGDLAFFICAVKTTSVADATVIGALQPALVLLIAGPLLNERLKPTDVVCTGIALAGVGLVVLGPGQHVPNSFVGDLLAFCALVSWTGYWITSKRARAHADALEFTTAAFLVAAITMTPVLLVSGESLRHVHSGDWLWIALLAVVPGCSNLLMNWAHRFLDASVSSIIVAANPVVAAAAAVVILHEPLTGFQVAGGLIALAAIALVASRHQYSTPPPIDPAA